LYLELSLSVLWSNSLYNVCRTAYTLVTSAPKDRVQGRSADFTGHCSDCTVMLLSIYGSLHQSPTSRPDKDFGLPPRTICVFLLSDCLLLEEEEEEERRRRRRTTTTRRTRRRYVFGSNSVTYKW